MAGHPIAIDDYGAGYSSLGRLRHLTVDELKIDRLLLADVGHDPQAEAIMRSAIDLAHALGLAVTAEGVEDARALDLLVGLGCDFAQG